MKPRLVHQEAMKLSFQAKQAFEEGLYENAFLLYKEAAELESQVAEFYFDKPNLEPTRSILIRSAAFLNLKAGLIESAQKFIFFGLLNIEDELIKSQLEDALELAVSLNKLKPKAASEEYNYLNLLRQRSIHYIIEPTYYTFGNAVSLEMIKDFSENYLKSLKSFAVSNYKKSLKIKEDLEDSLYKEFEKLVNPLVTNSAYGSFKFSVANDFLVREGEKKEVSVLKSNIVSKYHQEVFTNPLTDRDIAILKNTYSDEEINEIFRPLTKIKAPNSKYKIGYYDSSTFEKVFLNRIVNKQKTKLITTKQITQEDIGELENYIVHKRSSQAGKITKKTIFKEELKSLEVDLKTSTLELREHAPIILAEEILITMSFDSNKGFTFSFSDFSVEFTDVEYNEALAGFYLKFYNKLIRLANLSSRNEEQEKDWQVVKKLIANPDALKKME